MKLEFQVTNPGEIGEVAAFVHQFVENEDEGDKRDSVKTSTQFSRGRRNFNL